MNKTQIQALIENLRIQTAANSITPTMLANILTELNNNAAANTQQEGGGTITVTSSDAPLLYCEVQNGLLILRNYEYYKALGLEPILFRYIKKKNRWRIAGCNFRYGPKKKGWFANGKQGTIRVEGGIVSRTAKVINSVAKAGDDYRDTAETFVKTNADAEVYKGITWGCSYITKHTREGYRMVRLPFAIGYAPRVTNETSAVTVANLVSNLAPFFIRGQRKKDDNYIWSFSR